MFNFFIRKKTAALELEVRVHSRSGLVFNGQARAISAANEVGVFDILPMHSRFVATFSGDLTIHQGKTQKKLDLNGGVIRVVDNRVEIFVGA